MASFDPMVTIHRGELSQIKRLMTSDPQKKARGQFYGLWTHSVQPVVQVVVGLPGTQPEPEKYFSKCRNLINENLGLCLLGEWEGSMLKKG